MAKCYQVTIERDYIAYGETEEEAIEKVKMTLNHPNIRVTKATLAQPIEQKEIIDVSPVNQRNRK